MSATSDKMRKEWKENDAKRDAGLTTPDDIVRFDDIQYSVDPVWNLLDVYRPKGVEGKLPVIVNVHGGGWVFPSLYKFFGTQISLFIVFSAKGSITVISAHDYLLS